MMPCIKLSLQFTYMYIHVYTCIYMYIHVYTCIYMYIHVYTCMLEVTATSYYQAIVHIERLC